MRQFRQLMPLAVAALCFLAFAAALPSLYARPRSVPGTEMEVALPRSVQVLMVAGDRYLAANIAGFRALVASTENMTDENYRVLGIVQKDLAWLNPAHEDNYYIAAAILPWNNEVVAAQEILRRASQARPFDWTPAFYYAFNALHFQKNPAEGAKWMQIAADHAPDELDKIQLQQLAAQWVSRGEDKQLAIRMHRQLAQETNHPAFARFLERRAQRLENIALLEETIIKYERGSGRKVVRLEELVESGVLPSLPLDPFGVPYSIDRGGRVVALKPTTQGPRSAP